MEEDIKFVDYSVVESLKEIGGDDFFREILSMYFNQSEEIMSNIKTNYSSGNIDEVKALAHKLKGSCLNIGVTKMAEVCRKLEKEIKDNNISNLSEIISELESVSSETNKQLSSLN